MRRWWWVLFLVAAAANLYMLYAPVVPGPPGGLRLDLVAHFGSFAAVTLTGLRAGLDPRWFLPVVSANAVLSEILQGTLLPNRSGDWTDVAADLLGVLVGALLAAALARRSARTAAEA